MWTRPTRGWGVNDTPAGVAPRTTPREPPAAAAIARVAQQLDAIAAQLEKT